MKIVLTADVKDIGQKGDEKEVKPGFARNFLLRRGLALLAESPEAQAIILAREKQQEEKAEETERIKQLINKDQIFTISFSRKAKGKKLFGSVKPQEISQAIEKKINLKPKRLIPEQAIKNVGEREILAVFSGGEKQKVSVKVKAAESRKSENLAKIEVR